MNRLMNKRRPMAHAVRLSMYHPISLVPPKLSCPAETWVEADPSQGKAGGDRHPPAHLGARPSLGTGRIFSVLTQPQLPEPDRVLCIRSLHNIALEIVWHRDDHLRKCSEYDRCIFVNDLLALVQCGADTRLARCG